MFPWTSSCGRQVDSRSTCPFPMVGIWVRSLSRKIPHTTEMKLSRDATTTEPAHQAAIYFAQSYRPWGPHTLEPMLHSKRSPCRRSPCTMGLRREYGPLTPTRERWPHKAMKSQCSRKWMNQWVSKYIFKSQSLLKINEMVLDKTNVHLGNMKENLFQKSHPVIHPACNIITLQTSQFMTLAPP